MQPRFSWCLAQRNIRRRPLVALAGICLGLVGQSSCSLGAEHADTVSETAANATSDELLSTNATESSETVTDSSGDATSEGTVSGESDTTTAAQDLCDDAIAQPDFIWDLDHAIEWPAPARAAAGSPSGVWVCGVGFTGFVPPGEPLIQVPDDAMDPCVDIASDGNDGAWVLSDAGRVRRLVIDADEISESATLKVAGAEFFRIRPHADGAWLAAGAAGLLALEMDDKGALVINPAHTLVSADARDAVAFADGIVVADGRAGIKYFVEGKLSAQKVGNGFATQVLVEGTDLIVLRGGWGLDRLQFSEGKFALRGSLIPDGTVRRALRHENEVWATSGRDLLRLDLPEDGRPAWAGSLARPYSPSLSAGWILDVIEHAGELFVVTDEALVPVDRRPNAGPSPSIATAAPFLSLDDAVDSEPSQLVANLENLGAAPLQVWAEAVPEGFELKLQPGPEQSVCGDARASVAPGRSLRFDVTYHAKDTMRREVVLSFRTNDPKREHFTVQLEVNSTGPVPDATVPDFKLMGTVGPTWNLAQGRGKVQLLKLFMRMCASCLQELAYLETEVVPRFAGKPFEVWVVNNESSGVNADQMRIDQLSGLPVLHDFELGVLRYFRQPAALYPLQAVVDKDGKLAYVGASIEDAIKVIETLVGK